MAAGRRCVIDRASTPAVCIARWTAQKGMPRFDYDDGFAGAGSALMFAALPVASLGSR